MTTLRVVVPPDADAEPLPTLHLIQYSRNGVHRTTVLCRQHRAELHQQLRAWRIGLVGTTAPMLSRCDACQNGTVTP